MGRRFARHQVDREVDRPPAAVVGPKTQSATNLAHEASDNDHAPSLGLCLNEADTVVADGQQHPRRLNTQCYRDFPNASGESMQISIVDQFGYDDTQRGRCIQGNPYRLHNICKFDIILLVKFWKVEAERTDVITEVYNSAHSRPEKMIEDFCKSHHSESDGPEGPDTGLIMITL